MSWTNSGGPAEGPTSAADTFTGDPIGNDAPPEAGAGNDVMLGLGGDDILDGGADDDSLLGGAGDDLIQGGNGNDTLDGGPGYDQIIGGPGQDLITDPAGEGHYRGDAGDDTIALTLDGAATAYAGVHAFGGSGNDLITASGPGIDNDGTTVGASLHGEDGNDTIVGTDVDDAVNNGDMLYGGDGSDSILGGAGADYIAADDPFALTPGDDTVLAGAGNDSVSSFDGIDSLDGGEGIDLATIDRSQATAALGYTVDGATGGFLGTDGTTAANFENFTITTGAGNDTVALVGGNDNAFGGLGNDLLSGGTGDDQLTGDGGNDTLDGGLGYDQLFGGEGNDLVTDAGGEGYYTGDAGNDTIAVTLDGSATNFVFARIEGGDGDDLITASGPGISSGGSRFGASLFGDAGNDTIIGSDVDDPIRGGDAIEGGDGDDSILGGAGDDVIRGDSDAALSPGRDTVIGGAGNDDIATGGGDDLVIWRPGDGNDTVNMGDGADRLFLEGWTPGGNATWSVSADGDHTVFTHVPTGATVHARNFEEVTCFAEGTRIMTAHGEMPVECLRAGDLVLALHGGPALQPLVWVGRTRVDLTRMHDRARAAPVRIRAGALGPGIPVRDLRVSPDHAVFLDGRLVPAGLLVNGSTIQRETWCRQVTYYHVELARHGLVISDGAVSETYFDDGNRHLFDNAGVAALVMDFAALRGNGRYAAAACAPVAREGDPALERIRRRIAALSPAEQSWVAPHCA